MPPSCLLDTTLGTHHYVLANGIRFHYVSAGKDSKPLMLLLHGFPEVCVTPGRSIFFPKIIRPPPPSHTHTHTHTHTLRAFLVCVFQFWFCWRHQLKEFAKDYRVVAVDMRLAE